MAYDSMDFIGWNIIFSFVFFIILLIVFFPLYFLLILAIFKLAEWTDYSHIDDVLQTVILLIFILIIILDAILTRNATNKKVLSGLNFKDSVVFTIKESFLGLTMSSFFKIFKKKHKNN